jgi:hypothetical protein
MQALGGSAWRLLASRVGPTPAAPLTVFRHMRWWGNDVPQMRVVNVVVLHHRNRRGGCGGMRPYVGSAANSGDGPRLALTPEQYRRGGHFGAIRLPLKSNNPRCALALRLP